MDEIDKNAVHFACSRKSPRVLKLLTDKDKRDADLEISDKRGCQLIYVTAARQFDCSQHLLNLGCDIYATDKASRNALHWATQGGNIKTVRKILGQPGVANSVADLDGWTAGRRYAGQPVDQCQHHLLIPNSRHTSLSFSLKT